MVTSLYTIFCEYDKGSYLSQVDATDQYQALLNWGTWVRSERQLGDVSIEVAKDAFDCDPTEISEITPIEGLQNVWCWDTVIADNLVLVTIVRSG